MISPPQKARLYSLPRPRNNRRFPASYQKQRGLRLSATDLTAKAREPDVGRGRRSGQPRVSSCSCRPPNAVSFFLIRPRLGRNCSELKRLSCGLGVALLNRHEFVCWNIIEKRRQFDALSDFQQLQECMEWVLHLWEKSNPLWYGKIVPDPCFDYSSWHISTPCSIRPAPFRNPLQRPDR